MSPSSTHRDVQFVSRYVQFGQHCCVSDVCLDAHCCFQDGVAVVTANNEDHVCCQDGDLTVRLQEAEPRPLYPHSGVLLHCQVLCVQVVEVVLPDRMSVLSS